MNGQDYEQFVRVWQAASGVKEVADAFGVTPSSARVRAYRLRRAGVKLKRFKPGRRPLDVERLNRVIEEDLAR